MSYHLREGFYFERLEDDTVQLTGGGFQIQVPVTEWASAIAATSKRGDTRDAWLEAISLLNKLEQAEEGQPS